MTVCGVRRSVALACLSILIVTPLLGTASADPTLHPPGTSVKVGDLGVVNGNAYTTEKSGILVSPGTTVTVKADYLFRDLTGPNGYSAQNVGTLRVMGGNIQVGVDQIAVTFSSPGAYSWNGTLAVTFAVPENVRSVTAILEARLTHFGPWGSELIDSAQSSAGLTLVAVPEPVRFVTQDLKVRDKLDVGTITMTPAVQDVDATSGLTFVSTDLGTRLRASAVAERPAISGMSELWVQTNVFLNAQIEGGISVSASRTLFADYCSDWTNHACSISAANRSEVLELVLPTGSAGPREVLTTTLGASHELNAYNGLTGYSQWESYWLSSGGRHVVVSV